MPWSQEEDEDGDEGEGRGGGEVEGKVKFPCHVTTLKTSHQPPGRIGRGVAMEHDFIAFRKSSTFPPEFFLFVNREKGKKRAY